MVSHTHSRKPTLPPCICPLFLLVETALSVAETLSTLSFLLTLCSVYYSEYFTCITLR